MTSSRLEQQRASGIFTTGASGVGVAAMQSVGFDPAGQVRGVRVQRFWGSGSTVPTCSSLGQNRGGPPVPLMARELEVRHSYSSEIDGLRQEAARLCADGIVDVDLSDTYWGTATAVRGQGGYHPRRPFTCDLSAVEVATLLRSGWVPVEFVVGVGVLFWHEDAETRDSVRQRHLHPPPPNVEVLGWSALMAAATSRARDDLRSRLRASGRSWNENQEIVALTQALYRARELAMGRMVAEADALGADGIVGVRLQMHVRGFGESVTEFVAVGTAVKAEGARAQQQWRTNKGLPFTSDLSGQDFWTLLQTGHAPLGLVLGTCVYHLAQRALGGLVTAGRNVELVAPTQGFYEAREAAMARMQAEAEQLDAEGVVGVHLDTFQHTWGPHTTEFIAIGTAVRPYAVDHVITTPTMTVDMG